MKIKIIAIILVLLSIFSFNQVNIVHADSLSDTIDEQIENIDLSKLEEYFNSLENLPENVDFFSCINQMLKGEYDLNFNSLIEYIFNAFFTNIKSSLPTFLTIISIALFCGIIQKFKSNLMSESIGEIILFVCLITIIILLINEITSIWNMSRNIIKNIANLTEIMSPIILTLMVASGGNVSASVYKPAVAFLSNGVINIFLSIIMPLIAIMIIFYVISNFSSSLKLEKFAEVGASLIKWIIGIIITIFGIFLSVQGLTSATYDGVSIRATKYALSNSIPIVGGFIKDGFDLVVAGSILIKNVVGITSVFALFYLIISPIIYIATFSLLLKLVSAIISQITDSKITSFCNSMSKCVSYITASLISVGFMLFITILLITFSANSFI